LLFQPLRVLTPPSSLVFVAVAPLSVGQQSTCRDSDIPPSCVVGISQTRLSGTGGKGALWAAIPKWAYITFGIAVLAAGGFGYGFFYQLNENSKLKDVEWLYRYERGLNRDMNVVMHRERQMLHGTTHEVDSLKSLIRHHEQRVNADTTFIYYYPSNL